MIRPVPGEVYEFEPGLRMVLAPNPSPMTHWGTNTFLVGTTEIAVIDPGPSNAQHLESILAATKGASISHILVTHPHLDHSPLARQLSEVSKASVFGFGTAEAGRRDIMVELAKAGLAGGGEGVDLAFHPDVELAEGDQIVGAGWSLNVLHTPGHFAGHLAFQLEDRVISGDHVMDWSSSLVSPPDGDVGAFIETSLRLKALKARKLYPSHGGVIEDPEARLDWLIAHRRAREAGILEALGATPIKISELTRKVYTDIQPRMLPAAERNVFAHLIDLVERNMVLALPRLGLDATFKLNS